MRGLAEHVEGME